MMSDTPRLHINVDVFVQLPLRLCVSPQVSVHGDFSLRVEVAYDVCIGDRGTALKAERRIKGLPKQRKEEIVASRPNRNELMIELEGYRVLQCRLEDLVQVAEGTYRAELQKY